MADQTYPVPENPVYNPEIRALQDTDPAQATGVFNPLFEQLIENTHATKLAGDANAVRIEEVAENAGDASEIKLADGTNVEDAIGALEEATDALETAMPKKADLDANGKVQSSQLPAMNYVPTSRKVNNKALSSDITLTAADVGAAKTDLSNVSDEAFAEKASEADIGKTFVLQITFESAMQGFDFTVTGGGFSHTGTVPASLTANVVVPAPNTTYTVTCQTATKTIETTNYFGIYALELALIPEDIANATWAQIAAAIASGTIPAGWTVGMEKDVTLTTGETLTFQIYDFNHDDLADGTGKAGITFGMRNLMAATQQMNSSNTNVGGYTGSALYTWLTTTLWNSLPADLRAVIKPVKKKTSAGNNSTTINTNNMSVFLFSEVECFGTITYSAAGEGTQYPIFTDAASRVKYLSNGAGSAHYWWERSPYASSATYFCNVSSSGGANSSGASNSRGVCFGFCI